MYCNDVQSCFSEINAYCSGKPTGHVLLVNVENYNAHHIIRQKLEADNTKKCVYVSKTCIGQELPDIGVALNSITGSHDYVLIGYSQAGMLRSAAYMERMIDVLLEEPIRGHAIVLLDHCEQYIKKYYSIHPDITKRVVLLEGEQSVMPRVRIASSEKDCIGVKPLANIQRLLSYFEQLNDDIVKNTPEITVISKYSARIFNDAVYSVSPCDNVYISLRKNYPEIAAGTVYNYGSERQWKYLAGLLSQFNSMSSVAFNTFGSSDYLYTHLGETIAEGNELKVWLLWLCMKTITSAVNKYVSIVMGNSKTVEDFEEHVYMDLLDISKTDDNFLQYYTERKRMLEMLPENLIMLDKYTTKTGIYQRDAIYYLTDQSEREELAFMQCLATYDYSSQEILEIVERNYPSLGYYLHKFLFNSTNTKVPEGSYELWNLLTDYFEEYKLQKITNRIMPCFINKVDKIAIERPYNKLPARSAIVQKMNKDKSQLYFFDALGVEYLGFIQTRCDHYGLIPEISIGHCELPSITSKNKEFLQFFSQPPLDIKELDEIKHHSQVIDYQHCKEPVHLFRELQIIDEELRKIQSRLKQGHCEKAIIISDHGASRLAVIYEHENEKLELAEKGKHSGRCCPAMEDPHIPFASYENGYSVLANYERFKGSRKANVEVHGGASLEEVIVPVITLTKKPAEIDICVVNPVVIIKGKEPASITLFSNIPIKKPKLVVNEKVYIGEFCEDDKHIKFVMPELRRSKDWSAEFYDGEKKLASDLEFHVQRNTQEQSLFKKMTI